jgi:hypothetical protein
MLRVKPGTDAFVECNIERPFEIHLVQFESEQDFEGFLKDKQREQFLHLKQQSIKSVFLTKGTKV